jgi:hypothetical protein
MEVNNIKENKVSLKTTIKIPENVDIYSILKNINSELSKEV